MTILYLEPQNQRHIIYHITLMLLDFMVLHFRTGQQGTKADIALQR